MSITHHTAAALKLSTTEVHADVSALWTIPLATPDSSSCQTPVLASVYPAWAVRKVFVATAVFTGGTVTPASALVNTPTLARQVTV